MSVRGKAAATLVALGIAGLYGASAHQGPVAASVIAACNTLPNGTCYGDKLNAYVSSPDGGPDQDCTTCLQGPKCCDVVGACDEDLACVLSFQATHACVVDGGASAESRCKGTLINDKSRAAYDCMRTSCGPRCGVPSCTIDKEITLLANPDCDRCMTGSCCQPINDCYGNRQCKLALQCITQTCTDTLGQQMGALGAQPGAAIEATTQAICTGAPLPPGVDDAGACIKKCLDDFAPEKDKGGTNDDLAARCLSFKVYTCGAAAHCGSACTLSTPTRDAAPE
jgi:hypothetical protein